MEALKEMSDAMSKPLYSSKIIQKFVSAEKELFFNLPISRKLNNKLFSFCAETKRVDTIITMADGFRFSPEGQITHIGQDIFEFVGSTVQNI